MANNRGMYLDYDTPPGRFGLGGGMLVGILLVILLAAVVGIGAYQISKKHLDELPDVTGATPTPVSAIVDEVLTEDFI